MQRDKSHSSFREETAEDDKEIVPQERKISKTSISGKYLIQDKDGKLLKDSYFEFKGDGTWISKTSGKWEIEGNMIKIKFRGYDKEEEKRVWISNNTIVIRF